jgi:hypothetical protein
MAAQTATACTESSRQSRLKMWLSRWLATKPFEAEFQMAALTWAAIFIGTPRMNDSLGVEVPFTS